MSHCLGQEVTRPPLQGRLQEPPPVEAGAPNQEVMVSHWQDKREGSLCCCFLSLWALVSPAVKVGLD